MQKQNLLATLKYPILICIVVTLILFSQPYFKPQQSVQVQQLVEINNVQPECKISYIMAGPRNEYDFSNIQKWIAQVPSSCDMQIVRNKHPLVTSLISPTERELFNRMDISPILQADYLKSLIMYYYSGLVIDFDVAPNEYNYPADFHSSSDLAECDVLFTVEHECAQWNGCNIKANAFPNSLQLQTWLMYAKKPHSPFYRAFLDYLLKVHAEKSPKDLKAMNVQRVAGSGILTEFMNLYLDTKTQGVPAKYKDKEDLVDNILALLPLDVASGSNLFESNKNKAVFRRTVNGENICIGSHWYTLATNLHYFAGTWKGQ